MMRKLLIVNSAVALLAGCVTTQTVTAPPTAESIKNESRVSVDTYRNTEVTNGPNIKWGWDSFGGEYSIMFRKENGEYLDHIRVYIDSKSSESSYNVRGPKWWDAYEVITVSSDRIPVKRLDFDVLAYSDETVFKEEYVFNLPLNKVNEMIREHGAIKFRMYGKTGYMEFSIPKYYVEGVAAKAGLVWKG